MSSWRSARSATAVAANWAQFIHRKYTAVPTTCDIIDRVSGERKSAPRIECVERTGEQNETENPQFDPGAPGAENTPGAARILPTLSQVQEFFNTHVYPEMEAGKFFHHYQANGWRQGGKTLITDWQAAAHKWILNIHPQKVENNDRYTKQSTGLGRLHVNENKSYSDPL